MKVSDTLELKDQVAVALVESVFRRAGYALSAFHEKRVPPHVGREDVPNFTAAPHGVADMAGARPVKVRYRRQIREYLSIEARRGGHSFFAYAKRYWPGLVVVFLTDNPDVGHSSFQVLDLEAWSLDEMPTCVDLFAHPTLNIYRLNVEEHEVLAQRILALFSVRRPGGEGGLGGGLP